MYGADSSKETYMTISPTEFFNDRLSWEQIPGLISSQVLRKIHTSEAYRAKAAIETSDLMYSRRGD
jgi:hypothetical protein